MLLGKPAICRFQSDVSRKRDSKSLYMLGSHRISEAHFVHLVLALAESSRFGYNSTGKTECLM